MIPSRVRPRPRFANCFFARRMDALPNGDGLSINKKAERQPAKAR